MSWDCHSLSLIMMSPANNLNLSSRHVKPLQQIHKNQEAEGKTCNYCDEMFSSEKILRNHVIGQHNFACTTCKTRFSTELSLHRYRDISTSGTLEDQYYCRPCSRKKQLTEIFEQKLHNCAQCTKGFYRKANLLTHMERSHKKLDHYCDPCRKFFSTKGTLKVHTKSKHK